MYVSKNTRKVYVTSIIYDDKGYVFICQSTNCIIQGEMNNEKKLLEKCLRELVFGDSSDEEKVQFSVFMLKMKDDVPEEFWRINDVFENQGHNNNFKMILRKKEVKFTEEELKELFETRLKELFFLNPNSLEEIKKIANEKLAIWILVGPCVIDRIIGLTKSLNKELICCCSINSEEALEATLFLFSELEIIRSLIRSLK